MIELKHNMRVKEFEKAIDEGLITEIKMKDISRYRIEDTGIWWYEWHSFRTVESLMEAGQGNAATIMANMVSQDNHLKRRHSLLRHEHNKLKQLALDTGVIKRNGRPCSECKSTNTETEGQIHYVEGGYAQPWSRQCFDCEHCEVGGDRF